MNLIFRPAEPADADAVIPLIYSSAAAVFDFEPENEKRPLASQQPLAFNGIGQERYPKPCL
jgi:hypothetical protein